MLFDLIRLEGELFFSERLGGKACVLLEEPAEVIQIGYADHRGYVADFLIKVFQVRLAFANLKLVYVIVQVDPAFLGELPA